MRQGLRAMLDSDAAARDAAGTRPAAPAALPVEGEIHYLSKLV